VGTVDIVQLRARLRRDLRDEDPDGQRWSDAELDRHLQRAARELSLAVPLEAVAILTAPGASRDLSLASLEGLVEVEAVEYPVGLFPPNYVPFSLWGDRLTLLGERVPAAGEGVRVYYTRLHTLDATVSTVPAALEDLLLTGAAAYAALEWAGYAANRINVGGEDVWRRYLTWGEKMLSLFQQGLERHSRRNSVRSRRLYTPARPASERRG